MLTSHLFYFVYQRTSASLDSQVKISPSKAKELGVSSGDTVVLIGRRRKASYARVAIAKKSPTSRCQIPFNLAKNLRLRNDDKVKLVVLEKDSGEEEDKDSRSGDLLLLTNTEVPTVASVTFSPIEDSLRSLEAAEGGDELSEKEIQTRFVDPYMEKRDDVFTKQGNILVLRDDKGKMLEFMVAHVGLENEETDEAGEFTNFLIGA